MALSFVLDEHLRGPLWQAILKHNLHGENLLDVVRVGDVYDLPLGASDPEILTWAERESRLLVTEDRHTMQGHLQGHLAQGHHAPGVLINRRGHSIRSIVESLELIAHVGLESEFADVVTYIP